MISLIAAVARNGVIGRGGELPWRLPTDLKRFRELTLGKPLLMGRRTYESIGRPLPGREVIVVTRAREFSPSGVHVSHSLEEALDLGRSLAKPHDEVMVAGGAEIYAQALPQADLLYRTDVHAEPEGDTLFPALDGAWEVTSRRFVPAGPNDSADMTFLTLRREERRNDAERR